MPTRIQDLPEELLVDGIFGKLPIWSQWEARGVCKSWKKKMRKVKSCSPEKWLVLDTLIALHFYNLTQKRWVKKKVMVRSIVSNGRLECSVNEQLIFLIREGPPDSIKIWNAVTKESSVHEIPLDVSVSRAGAYVDETTGRLQLVLYGLMPLEEPDEDPRPVMLFKFDPQTNSCEPLHTEGLHDLLIPYFNNLSADNPVVPFLNVLDKVVEWFDVQQNGWCEETEAIPNGEQLSWYCFESKACFCLETYGIYEVQLLSSGVLQLMWYDYESRDWYHDEATMQDSNKTLQDVVTEMANEASNQSYFCFCSDGVDCIWAVMPFCSSKMLEINVRTGVCSVLKGPSGVGNLDKVFEDGVRVVYITM